MKKYLLALAAVVIIVGVAVADYNITDKGSYKSNAQTGLRVNTSGDLRVEEINPQQNFALNRTVMTTILGGRNAGAAPTLPAVLQDSTEAIDVRGYNGLSLMMYPTFNGGVSAVAVAIQVRWHYSTQVDSVSTFIEQGSRSFAAAQPTSFALAGVRDSIGSLFNIPSTSTGASRYSLAGANAEQTATPDEQVFVFTNVSGTTRGRILRIFSPNSSTYCAGPYMSIRVRYLNAYNGSGAALGESATAAAGPLRLSATLVGWR